MIRTRKKGGLEGWIGENEICEADRALRFQGAIGIRNNPPSSFTHIYCAFRRFFFDGKVVAKFEVGIGIRHGVEEFMRGFDGGKFLEHVLSLPTSVTVGGHQTKCELIRAGQTLAEAYKLSSTRHGVSRIGEAWINSGIPVLFLEQQKDDISFPFRLTPVYQEANFQLLYGLVPHHGPNYRIWILHTEPDYLPTYARTDIARSLRISLLRLNAERECLRIVLRLIDEGRIKKIDDNVQDYLDTTASRIIKLENKTEKIFGSEVLEVARQAIDAITPGERTHLLGCIEAIRRNVYNNIAHITGEDQPIVPTHEKPTTIIIKKLIAHDEINVKGSAIIGGQDIVQNIYSYQQCEEAIQRMDFLRLARELEALHCEIAQLKNDPEHEKSMKAIASAAKNAKARDKRKLLKNLSKAGSWALDVATKIAAPVAAEALKVALNLPRA